MYLKVDVYETIHFQVGRLVAKHAFYVIPNLNINIIIGCDWLQENGARIYYDLGALCIKVTYVI